MITVSQLSSFDRTPWDEFGAWARARATAAREVATSLRAEATRVAASWPDSNGMRAVRTMRSQAASHQELAALLTTSAAGIDTAADGMSTQRTELRAVIRLVAQHHHLTGPDDSGHVTTSTEVGDLVSVLEHAFCTMAAGQLTLRARTALVRATGLDDQARLLLQGSPGDDTPTAADGPLDLSDAGITLQAEVNAQGRYGSCVTLALLLGLARSDPGFIRRHLTWDPATRTYRVTLYRFGVPVTTAVSPSAIEAAGSDSAGSAGPTWLSIYERAIEQVFGDVEDGQMVRTSLARITGQQAPLWFEPSVQEIERALALDPPGTVVAGTSGGQPQPSDIDPAKRLVPHHAYVVRGIDPNGNVVLQNPWGPAGGYDDAGQYYPGVVRLTPDEYRRWFGSGVVARPPS